MARGAISEKTSLTWNKTNSTEAPNQSSLELVNHSFISQIVYLIVAEHTFCKTDNIEVKTKVKRAQYITKSTDSIWNEKLKKAATTKHRHGPWITACFTKTHQSHLIIIKHNIKSFKIKFA